MNTLGKGGEWEGTAGGSHWSAAGLKAPGCPRCKASPSSPRSGPSWPGLQLHFLETTLRPAFLQDSWLWPLRSSTFFIFLLGCIGRGHWTTWPPLWLSIIQRKMTLMFVKMLRKAFFRIICSRCPDCLGEKLGSIPNTWRASGGCPQGAEGGVCRWRVTARRASRDNRFSLKASQGDQTGGVGVKN